tara:strand:+ start:1160 stop:2401 length:1242 start_codon:yes stop_codon:yes gene_type:complete
MIDQLKIDFNNMLKTIKISKENTELRKKNLNKFIKTGFPNKKVEEWKFSDLNQIINNNIGKLKFFNDQIKISNKEVINFKNFDHNKIIIENGLIKSINFDHEDKKNIVISEKNENDFFNNNNSLLNLNNALVSKYLKIIIKKNYYLKKPLVVYNVTSKDIESSTINQKLDIVLEKNSQLKLINSFEDYSKKNFININHNFEVGKDSILKNYILDFNKNTNIKYLFSNIDAFENSLVENFILSFGSKFFKNEINCSLKGKYSSTFINGIINLNNSQHHEIKTNINHLTKNTKSYQLIKSVLSDKSKGIYQGKIFVDSSAQKTDGYQLSKAILLNEEAEFDGKPELEIYADDVKCSHGSTSGNLDENSIFYLMTRGLNYQESKKLLINGFLLDVIDKITDPDIKELIKHITGIKS